MLGERAVVELGAEGVVAEYLVADRDAGDSFADGVDDAGAVEADHDREAVLGHRAHQPAADGNVDSVQRGRAHADAHLPGAWVWDRQIRDDRR